MQKKENNYAFIDGQNLNLGVKEKGWKIGWLKFRRHLTEKYGVTKAYYFIGKVSGNDKLYETLKKAGFELVFKETYRKASGEIKGNVDAEMVMKTTKEMPNFEKAVLVTSDGDFVCLAEELKKESKLRAVISPYSDKCSHLLKKAVGDYIATLDDSREKLEYTNKQKTP